MASHTRRAAHSTVSSHLAVHGDHELRELIEAAEPLGAGIGGRSALLDVSGTPVFVKRVPLTERELRPEHVRSTANVFGMPLACQYGIGAAPSFGAWRELATHVMTTDWVLSGEHHAFPLMYHWRVLPDAAPPLPEELADVEAVVAYWGGSPGVRRRLESLQQAPASLVLFLEYLPQTLHTWLPEPLQAGGESAERALGMVERELLSAITFMNARGLLHFDAHFQNILTDGRRLYFADYGLALSSGFDLTPAEADFFARHHDYDRAYALSYLVNWLIAELHGHRRPEREALIRAWAAGAQPPGGPSAAVSAITRHVRLAAVVTDFLGAVQHESRTARYPSEAISDLISRA